MPNNLESIIKDLYELDPTLRSEDKVVREVVASLLSNKPVVLPNQAFVADLREKLIVAHYTKPVNNQGILSPWFMYLAPVGIVAVLIFMMIPKPLSHQALPTELNEIEVVEQDSVSEESVGNTDDAVDAKRSFMVPEVAPASSDMRTMEMVLPMQAPSESFSISTQLPGQLVKVDFVSFTEPTFLVIQKDRQGNPGEVVGVSQVLRGQADGVEIVLMQKMLKDETFFVTAYRDDGDGIYTPGKDNLVFDASGSIPLQQMFSTSPF